MYSIQIKDFREKMYVFYVRIVLEKRIIVILKQGRTTQHNIVLWQDILLKDSFC